MSLKREPCPWCGCTGEQFDGHVCEDYAANGSLRNPALSTQQQPCPRGPGCALNKGAIHCFHCRRNWPPDETWRLPFDLRPSKLRRAS